MFRSIKTKYRLNRLREQVAKTADMREWDDNEFPRAYLLTFRTYGTWQHGDPRGSIDRYHNKFGGPRVPGNPIMKRQQDAKLKSQPVVLGDRQRPVVESEIRKVCSFRGWVLLAINVRSNHVHVVVWIGAVKPEAALRDFKAYATKALRNEGLWAADHGPWGDSGSKRYLWKESSVQNACAYVLYEQGEPLPDSF